MNRTEKARRRDRASWLALADLMGVTTVLGVVRIIEGTGGWEDAVIPGVLTCGCVYVFFWTKKEHNFRTNKK